MKKAINYLISAAFVAALAVLTSGLYLRFAPPPAARGGQSGAPLSVVLSPPAAPGGAELSGGEDKITAAAERVIPSVVGVSTAISKERSFFDPSDGEAWSMGSGIVVTEKGHILTNHHVISGGRGDIIITTADGKAVKAAPLWSDGALDLAIIKASSGLDLPVAPLGNSSSLKIGETAIAIGNPLSMQFQRTVTAGIISALNRTIALTENGQTAYMEDLIQTDASINPGNSGGPLINSKGEVIGINTIKVTSAEGMGFAIAINICRPVILSINEKGDFKAPYLGLYAFDRQMALYAGNSFPAGNGIFVTEVDAGSPAQKAGIKTGDIITQFADKKVNTMLDLKTELFYFAPGDSARIIISRGEKTLSLTAKLTDKAGS